MYETRFSLDAVGPAKMVQALRETFHTVLSDDRYTVRKIKGKRLTLSIRFVGDAPSFRDGLPDLDDDLLQCVYLLACKFPDLSISLTWHLGLNGYRLEFQAGDWLLVGITEEVMKCGEYPQDGTFSHSEDE
jgi:hypothetical protein